LEARFPLPLLLYLTVDASARWRELMISVCPVAFRTHVGLILLVLTRQPQPCKAQVHLVLTGLDITTLRQRETFLLAVLI
jgi:hypothetical protein